MSQSYANSKKILVIRYSAYGDIAATFPIIQQIRLEYPTAKIDYLISSGYKHIASVIPFVDNVIEFGIPSNVRGFINAFKYIGVTIQQGIRLFLSRYDIVIDLQSNNRSLVLRILAAAKISVSCNHHQYQKLSIERYSSATQKIGFAPIIAASCSVGYPVSESVSSNVADYLASSSIEGGYLCLAPAGLWQTKLWGLNYYAELARLFHQLYKKPVIVIGDKKERERGEEIKKIAGDFVFVSSGELPLATAVGLLQLAGGFVGNDSGLGHFAWTAGVPTVVICGPTNPSWVGPAGPYAKGLALTELDCIFCHSHLCKRGDFACMNHLYPLTVFLELKDLIEKKASLNKQADIF